MISAVRSCGCAEKCPSPSTHFSPQRTSSSKTNDCRASDTLNLTRRTAREPFENPGPRSPRISKDDQAKCPCPRPGNRDYDSMRGKCSTCCAGVFPESKVLSEIVEGGKPYKEIEAVINENRVVIRIQRESVGGEWDPPCECADDNSGDEKRFGRLGGGGCETRGSNRCGENVVLQKVDRDDSGGRRTGEREESCRTVTVYPQAEILVGGEPRDVDNDRESREKREKIGEPEVVTRIVDLEENPNVFVLRIRKRSENSERKNNIDLEFRTPRPWIGRPEPEPVPVSLTTGPETQSPTDIGLEKKIAEGKNKPAGKKKKKKKGK